MRIRSPLAVSAYCHGYLYASKTGDNRFPLVKAPLPTTLLWTPAQGYAARRIDCSSFMAWLAVYCCPDVTWDAEAYPDLQIFKADRLWSPVDAWERHGLGKRINDGDPPAKGWGFYQSWVDDQAEELDGDPIEGGHQWAYNGRLRLRLHSTRRGGRGVILEQNVDFEALRKAYVDGIQGVALRRAA